MKEIKSSNAKVKAFEALIISHQNCLACERMCNSQRIFGYSAGPLEASVMFIGEAPGRLGADASAIPFHGDKSGHNFEDLLALVGLTRYDIFVTNSVLCNPRDDRGNNSTPSPLEIENCSKFLKTQIEIINPKLIVTLGATALKALSTIEIHSLTLRNDVRKLTSWFGRSVIPLYHPGQRAMIHRKFVDQLEDYRFVAEVLRRSALPKEAISKPFVSVGTIIEALLKKTGPISYFSMHKLFYLIEYEAVKQSGQRLTKAYIVRQKNGPYCTDLHPSKLSKQVSGIEWIEKSKSLKVWMNQHTLFPEEPVSTFSSIDRIVNEVIEKYGSNTDEKLKTAVYMTRPMRDILLREKRLGRALYNLPLHLTRDDKKQPRYAQ
jgi:uracil-DNA glycosylase family 4